MTITTNNGATNGDDYVLFGVTMTWDEPGYFSDDEHRYAAGLFSPNYPLPVKYYGFQGCFARFFEASSPYWCGLFD